MTTMNTFSYATDSAMGTLQAASLQDAFDSLRAKITDEMIDDGATLWVEDAEGNRITLRRCS